MTLFLAIGNPLRRDDGVARRAAAGLETVREVHQLTPELATDLAPYDDVVFIDADVEAAEVAIEPCPETPHRRATLTHHVQPAEVLALARALFGFTGRAWLCRIPVEDLGDGEGLSPRAAAQAEEANRLLQRI